MGGRWLGMALGGVAAVAMAYVAACDLEAGGAADAVDASPDVLAHDSPVGDVSDASDASVDVGDSSEADAADTGPQDSGFDAAGCVATGGFVCGQACVFDQCRSCAVGTAACNATRVCGKDCAACTGQPFACYNCNASLPIGFCSAVKCDSVGGLVDCSCMNGDAGSCPGSTQICTGGGTPVCRTCGSGGTDHKQCANGLDCKESTGVCL